MVYCFNFAQTNFSKQKIEMIGKRNSVKRKFYFKPRQLSKIKDNHNTTDQQRCLQVWFVHLPPQFILHHTQKRII